MPDPKSPDAVPDRFQILGAAPDDTDDVSYSPAGETIPETPPVDGFPLGDGSGDVQPAAERSTHVSIGGGTPAP